MQAHSAAPKFMTASNYKQENPRETPLGDLPYALASLPPALHPFRDPRHDHLLRELEDQRLLLLTSYQGTAAYAAAFSIVNDDHFYRQLKRALAPTSQRARERSDLDLIALEELLGETPQILLIEIDRHCTLLDSTLSLGWGFIDRVRDRLESHCSYLVFAVNEDLMPDKAHVAVPHYSVSHLNYLLYRDFADRADELERRLLHAANECGVDLRELQHRVADRLAEGTAALEAFLLEVEEASSLPLAGNKKRWDVFISHASEDKEELARPLALLLREMGLKVWYDDFVLQLGNRIRRSIENGLAESRFGVVLLSPNFFQKEWTQRELDGLLALEGDEGIILPVWHRLNINDIKRFSPILADRVGISTSKGLTSVADQIFSVVRGHTSLK